MTEQQINFSFCQECGRYLEAHEGAMVQDGSGRDVLECSDCLDLLAGLCSLPLCHCPDHEAQGAV